MKLLKRIYYLPILFYILLFACQTKNGNVNAKPNFSIPPIEMGKMKLEHIDTTSETWKKTIERLDSFYKIQTRTGFNGSVLVGYKGKILYERYFGYANKSTKSELTDQSCVQLASVSKTFTGAAIMFLYQNNYLDIDKPVTDYIKDFPYKDVSVKMLLNHRSGIPDYTKWVGVYRKGTNYVYNDEVIQLMIKHKPRLEFKPNTNFKYSNSNYLLLASIIEEVSEMSYEKFLQTYIFDPLGMKNTYVFNPANGLPPNATLSYNSAFVSMPHRVEDGVYGDKGIYSTVRDMYRWDQSLYNNKFLSNETLETAYGPCSFERPGIKNYGLGWRMLCYTNGDKIIYHNGYWRGNNTCFYRFIQDNFTIIVLGNKLSSAIYKQPPVLYNIIKGTDSSSNGGFAPEELE